MRILFAAIVFYLVGLGVWTHPSWASKKNTAGAQPSPGQSRSLALARRIEKLQMIELPREWDWDEKVRAMGLPQRWRAVLNAIERDEKDAKAKQEKIAQIEGLQKRSTPFQRTVAFNQPMNCSLCATEAHKVIGEYYLELIAPQKNLLIHLDGLTLHQVEQHGQEFTPAQLAQLDQLFR